MDLDELIDRAGRLPPHHPLRAALLRDLDAVRDTALWLRAIPVSVPSAPFHLVGLSLGHLQARLAACEERAGEMQAVPA